MKHQKSYKSVTIPLDEDLAFQVEQAMIMYGLDNKRDAAAALLRAGVGVVGQDAFLSSVLQTELKNFRDNESAALAKFFEERARMFRSG